MNFRKPMSYQKAKLVRQEGVLREKMAHRYFSAGLYALSFITQGRVFLQQGRDALPVDRTEQGKI